MDGLYYGEGSCGCCQGVHDATTAFSFSAGVLAAFMRKVYRGFDTSADIEPAMWREILRIVNSATVDGLAEAGAPPTHEAGFYAALRHSNEVFAAFKVHNMGRLMAASLTGPDGKLKPFAGWARDVQPVVSHHVGAWLRTEYDTAVIRAHNAADWRRFERDKDVMPNLRWMPTTSPAPESSHRSFWECRLTLPVDDPFWNEHHPGDRWNCKCSLEQTDGPATPELKAEFGGERPQRGLENNTGRDGHTFSDTHPYFPDSCDKCCFYKPDVKNLFTRILHNRRKDCYNCTFVNKVINNAHDKQPPEADTYKDVYKGCVFASPYHGENELKENARLAAFVAGKLGRTVYLLPRLDPMNPIQARLRATLLPEGVIPGKNPDFLIGGRLFDGKSMLGIRRDATGRQKKNAIETRIKKAKEQADNIILEIPSSVTRKLIHRTVTNYLSRSSRERIVMVHWKNKLLIYGNADKKASDDI